MRQAGIFQFWAVICFKQSPARNSREEIGLLFADSHKFAFGFLVERNVYQLMIHRFTCLCVDSLALSTEITPLNYFILISRYDS